MPTNWKSTLTSPEVISAGMNFGGGLLQGAAQGKMDEKTRKQRQQEIVLQSLLDTQRQAGDEDLTRATQGLGSTQMDPFAAARFQSKADVLRQILGGASNISTSFDPTSGQGSISGGMRVPAGGLDMSALSPERLASASQNFYQHVGNVSPNVPAPDLGYGDTWQGNVDAIRSDAQTGIDQRRQQQQQAIQQFLSGGQDQPEEKKGSSIWKKLAKIGLIAGGGIATAMTGGAASPLLMAAIGAGTGAATGALDNGWKGALLGGGLGAATGGFGGGAASGVKQGLGQAVKSTLTSPSALTQIAGAGIGGRPGTALQTAGQFLPRGGPGQVLSPSGTPVGSNLVPARRSPWQNVRF